MATSTTNTTSKRTLAIAGFAAVAVLWPLLSPKVAQFYGALSAIYALVALSLIILVGWTGQISLGHAAFMGFGVYIGQKILTAGIPVPLAILMVAAFGAAVSLILGVTSLRLRGVYLTIATLAFGAACQRYFFQLSSVRSFHAQVVPRPNVLGFHIHSDRQLYYLVLIVLGLCMLIGANLRRTDAGRALFAIRDSEDAAQAMAIKIAPYKIGAFALSAALATVAGLFYGMLYQATPGPEQFGVLQSLFLLAMPVLGGLESLFGALIGGTFLATAQPLVNVFHVRIYLASSAALILVLLSGFDGITGMVKAFLHNARQAVAPPDQVRYGTFVPEELATTDGYGHTTNGRTTNGHTTNGHARQPPRLHVRLIGRVVPGSVVKARVHT
jgi:branched-chain amino acid transport system permease protein